MPKDESEEIVEQEKKIRKNSPPKPLSPPVAYDMIHMASVDMVFPKIEVSLENSTSNAAEKSGIEEISDTEES